MATPKSARRVNAVKNPVKPQSPAVLDNLLAAAITLAAKVAGGYAAIKAAHSLGDQLCDQEVNVGVDSADAVESALLTDTEAMRSRLTRQMVEVQREMSRLRASNCEAISAAKWTAIDSVVDELDALTIPRSEEVTGKRIPGETRAETILRLLNDDLRNSMAPRGTQAA